MIKPKLTVQKMKTYDPPLEGRAGKLRLDFNENTLGCSPRVIKALKKITPEQLATYPEYNSTNKKVAKFFNCKQSEILLTNGIDEAIKIIMETYLEKNDQIIIPSPTFAMFNLTASLIGASITPIKYKQDLSFPTKNVLERINPSTKMIILVNPNNPTSSIVPEKDIIAIIKKAKNAIILIDEAYYEFYGKTTKDLIKTYKNLIITRTFSKAWGLAGLRIGTIISNKYNINNLKKVISPYSVNTLALIALEAALKDKNFIKQYVKKVSESKNYLKKELKNLRIKTYPSYANFIIADFGKNCNLVYDRLKEKNILVRNRSRYPLLKNCLRLGIGNLEQTKKLITEIKKILRNKVILFDMDGVLVDVSRSYRLAIKKTVEFFSKQKVSDKNIQDIKELGGYNNDWDLSEALIQKKKLKIPKKKIIDKFQSFYWGARGLINNEKWLLPKKDLSQLSKKYRLGIVTGRPKIEAMFILKKFKVLKFFETIIALEDYPENKSKPDPYSINLALKELENTNAFYLGDSIDDMLAAKYAKIIPIGIIPPNNFSKNLLILLKKNGAKRVLKDCRAIMEAIK